MAAQTRKQKVSITPLLRDTIRNLRKELNKRGDDLSRQLGRGASYISQLENGKIQEIEFNSLLDIFIQIYDMPKEDALNHFDSYIKTVIHSAKSKADLVNEIWLHTYVIQEMQFTITDEIVKIVYDIIAKFELLPEELIKEINCNNQFYLGSIYNYPPNQVFVNTNSLHVDKYAEDSYDVDFTIRYDIKDDQYFYKIIGGDMKTISYANMSIVLRVLFQHAETTKTGNLVGVLTQTKKCLLDNHFYNAFEIYDTAGTEQIESKGFNFYDDLVVNYKNKYDNSQKVLRQNIDKSLKEYYNANPGYACEMIETINNNFDFDIGFIFAVLASNLSSVPIYYRKEFLNEYRQLIEKYAALGKHS